MKVRLFLIYKIFQYFILFLYIIIVSNGDTQSIYLFHSFAIMYFIFSSIVTFLLHFYLKGNKIVILADLLSYIFMGILISDEVFGLKTGILIGITFPYLTMFSETDNKNNPYKNQKQKKTD